MTLTDALATVVLVQLGVVVIGGLVLLIRRYKQGTRNDVSRTANIGREVRSEPYLSGVPGTTTSKYSQYDKLEDIE